MSLPTSPRNTLEILSAQHSGVYCSSALLTLDRGSIIGPILTVYDRMQYLTISKFVLPLINERLKQLEPLGEKLPLYDQKPV